ncbi:MAG: hypothetical protein DBY35_14705 [Bacteroidales bacterium]|nr:MAG: hypothetical protein DBY35_14705 [Bacteroidales bacterium]
MNAIRCILISLFVLTSLVMSAQRRITPVEVPDKNTPAVVTDTVSTGKPASVVEMTDMSGHTVLVDTISGVEYRDTILTQAPKLVYPRFESVSIGVNVWDPLMRCFGQKYGLIGFWGELSIHNWIKPVVEIGLGQADMTPDNGNYTYKSSVAPYFKIGLNYNFLYNSDPAYSVYAGLRYGISNFSFEATDVTLDQSYWGDDVTFNVPSQRATVGYIEAAIGLKVMIFKNIYLGWDVRMHTIAHKSNLIYGEPWYIPGYGTRTSSFSASLSVSYTLPLHKRVPAVIDAEQ